MIIKRLYTLCILLYHSFIFLAGPFNKKASLYLRGRKKWHIKLLKSIKPNEKWIWFHCASLGEFEDCCETFFSIKDKYPNHKTLLTFYSPSGFEVMKSSRDFDLVLYMPLDIKLNATRFLDALQPSMIFFSRSELWYNFLTEIKKREIFLCLLALKSRVQ